MKRNLNWLVLVWGGAETDQRVCIVSPDVQTNVMLSNRVVIHWGVTANVRLVYRIVHPLYTEMMKSCALYVVWSRCLVSVSMSSTLEGAADVGVLICLYPSHVVCFNMRSFSSSYEDEENCPVTLKG